MDALLSFPNTLPSYPSFPLALLTYSSYLNAPLSSLIFPLNFLRCSLAPRANQVVHMLHRVVWAICISYRLLQPYWAIQMHH